MKGKIAICQLDGKIPNLALMKVAGYYESNGQVVEHYKGPLFWDEYERVYTSKIFSFTPTPAIPPNAVIGGTGIDFYNRLPPDIESHPLYINKQPKYKRCRKQQDGSLSPPNAQLKR